MNHVTINKKGIVSYILNHVNLIQNINRLQREACHINKKGNALYILNHVNLVQNINRLHRESCGR